MAKQKNPRQEIWSRAFSDDFCAGPLSPLFFSYVEGIFGENKARYHHGYLYTSLDLFGSLIRIPHFPPDLRKYLLLSYYPDHLHQQILNERYRPIKRRLFNLLIGMLKPSIIRGRILKAYTKFEKNYREYLDYFDKRIQENNTFKELFDLDEKLDKKFKSHWLISFAGGYQCIYAVSQLHHHLNQNFQDTSLVAPLLSGISSRTNEVNQAIQQLAQVLQNDPLFQKKLRQKNMSEISIASTSKNFSEAFTTFLNKHGHRGYLREVLYPTWQENPDILFKTIVTIAASEKNIKSKIENNDFEISVNKIKQLSDKTQKEIMRWVNLSRQFIKFREDERYVLDLHLSRKRKFYLKIAEKLKQKRLLEQVDDIFFIDLPTINRLIDGTQTSISDQVKQARISYAKYQHQLPPKFLFYDQISSSATSIKTKFSGTPASGGITTGYACIILSPEDIDKIQPNDILITRFTGPGWTSCFHLISGLVTEVGGPLSHGAIISREYGIPAVTGIKDILRYVSTGDYIMVDGNNGVVTFVKK